MPIGSTPEVRDRRHARLLELKRGLPWNRRLRRTRPGSGQLVTGDGFRAAADAVVDSLAPGPLRGSLAGAMVFVGLDGEASQVAERIRSAIPNLRGAAVVLHNGDAPPPPDLLGALTDVAASVWCVNHLDGDRRIRALPVGLENRWWCANGNPADFRPRSDRDSARQARILAAFRSRTSADRPRHLEDLRSVPTCDVVDWLPPRRLHDLMRTYMLVASPPGNGPDCHRTWEAMYLGAVPVVIRGRFPCFWSPLPVLEVDDFGELAALEPADVAAIHASATAEPTEALSLDWWLDRIRRSASNEGRSRA